MVWTYLSAAAVCTLRLLAELEEEPTATCRELPSFAPDPEAGKDSRAGR